MGIRQLVEQELDSKVVLLFDHDRNSWFTTVELVEMVDVGTSEDELGRHIEAILAEVVKERVEA